MSGSHKVVVRTSVLLVVLAATLAFATSASAASKDYSSPDAVCYSTGWCHWSEVCYDAFGGCCFDFWCPVDATLASECQYTGGFQPYAEPTTDTGSTSGNGSTNTDSNIDTISGDASTDASTSTDSNVDTIGGDTWDFTITDYGCAGTCLFVPDGSGTQGQSGDPYGTSARTALNMPGQLYSIGYMLRSIL